MKRWIPRFYERCEEKKKIVLSNLFTRNPEIQKILFMKETHDFTKSNGLMSRNVTFTQINSQIFFERFL